MSYFFRDKPRFSERLRGKLGDEIFQELKEQFDKDGSVFDGASRQTPYFDRQNSGFPRGIFEDDDWRPSEFRRRGDIRSHLDDLASKHPEFADHLIGPPWTEAPFKGGSFRNKKNPLNNFNNAYHNHPDEDIRSQSSSGSAGSGVSSHSEPEPPLYHDINQKNQFNMDNWNKNDPRNQRSMSAPPENRQPDNQQGPQRFVSRVDITPQQQNSTHNQPQKENSPGPQKQTSSNVRHIPIFVEGRDEPIISRHKDEADFSHQPHHSPPQFHRPSHFQQHYKPHSEWTSQFHEPIFEPLERRWNRTQQEPSRPQQEPSRPQQFRQTQPTPDHKPKPTQQQEPPAQFDEPSQPPKPTKPILPKDPLERVALVQAEVDSLTEQVKEFSGTSRQDKHYIYLDEMLTRELIKLDDIETEGKENVRQARKNAIKSIQDSISLLESKVPLPGQIQEPQLENLEISCASENEAEAKSSVEPMVTAEIEQSGEIVPNSEKAIPLPPCPMSTDETSVLENMQIQTDDTPTDNVSLVKESSVVPMEVVRQSPVKEVTEQQMSTEESTVNPDTKQTTTEEKPAKSPKKSKKSKKPPAPISETPIPLPAPESK